MEIAGGIAAGMALASPRGDLVRPTSIRARRALFDSLGDLSGKVFADLCAGSGAMGMEAASRGADEIIFAESAASSIRTIEENIARIRKTGVEANLTVVSGQLPGSSIKLARCRKPDFLFADPPYPVSEQLFNDLLKDSVFTEWASEGRLFWELPDTGGSLRPPEIPWKILTIRMLGPARFMVLKAEKTEKSDFFSKKSEKKQ